MKNKILLICLFLLTGTAVFAQNRHLTDDRIDIFPFIHQEVDILGNDVFLPGDSIIRIIGTAHLLKQKDSTGQWHFTTNYDFWGVNKTDTGFYKVFLNTDTLTANIIYTIHDNGFDHLDINNISARFDCKGMHFFYDSSQYFVPKNSGKTSVFSGSLWIGGKDENGGIHIAAQRYGQGPNVTKSFTQWDYYPGPVMSHYSEVSDNQWNYIWNIRKSDIEYHKQHWWEPDYQPVHDIMTWPGNGDTTLGQAWHLAPFYDMNGDGIYDPLHGDHPEVRGDQALYFIHNDDRIHKETQGEKLKIEVHGMAYAFDLPSDSAMFNSVFLHYRIINRSQNTYDSTFLGVFTDIDLGYSQDDYSGCDVERNMYYGYNGTPEDGTGQVNSYGANPPAQGVVLLSGPVMDADGNDNPRYDIFGNQKVDFSVNGRAFGDQVADNERLGMTGFMKWLSPSYPSQWSDWFFDRYYKYLCGYWSDGTRFRYGGQGHPSSGGTGPECRFLFPGMSDTVNWGTGGILPDPKDWTDVTINALPGDNMGLQSSGPYTFRPGDVQEIDIAYIWARDYVNGNSLGKLQEYADQINLAFINNQLSNGQQFYGISDQDKPSFKLYPNPAKDFVTIEFDKGIIPVSAEIISSGGMCLRSYRITATKTTLDLTGIPAGLYVIKANTSSGTITKKIMVR